MSIEELYEVYKKHPNVCTDTRSISKGCIFYALKGEKFNGNSFAEDALGKGASFVVIDEPGYKKDDRFILVEDVLVCLQHLANYHRRQLKCPVIAITGSNGKTTTKELINRVLEKKFKTHCTKGNFNNHIGVPLTLLSASSDCEMLVVEMGANHQHEIAMLSAIAMPDFGIISNVGKAHLEGFGGFEGVKKGKGELYKFLAEHHGSIFINVDNPHLVQMAKERNVKHRIVYGTGDAFDCSGKLVASVPFLKVEWKAGGSKGTIDSKLIGEYNFENILAAVCIGIHFGVRAEDVCNAIENYTPDNSRSQFIVRGSNTIILDAYNANPSSMEAALKNFAVMEGRNKIVFLGEMAELGEESEQEHKRIIELLRGYRFDKVVLVGENFSRIESDFAADYFPISTAAADWMKNQKITEATILIKGSRSSKMEAVLEGL
ncbi:MAG: UDP-N-acetylmuramoyl-tripeptide--D-alanyl-D-alanine ligase [Bacteroidetes bacterium]|nr:UDP-N-acetylmuramoyl-tripeptide--D-alanyl-D-alanine ligase [Bacteroidota bacterium]